MSCKTVEMRMHSNQDGYPLHIHLSGGDIEFCAWVRHGPCRVGWESGNLGRSILWKRSERGVGQDDVPAEGIAVVGLLQVLVTS